jgi:hypothetical protein
MADFSDTSANRPHRAAFVHLKLGSTASGSGAASVPVGNLKELRLCRGPALVWHEQQLERCVNRSPDGAHLHLQGSLLRGPSAMPIPPIALTLRRAGRCSAVHPTTAIAHRRSKTRQTGSASRSASASLSGELQAALPIERMGLITIFHGGSPVARSPAWPAITAWPPSLT